MKIAGSNALLRRMLEAGKISPRAWRKQMAERGLLTRNSINESGNARKFPAVSKVRTSNNTRPKRQAPEPSYGDWYGGRNGRP